MEFTFTLTELISTVAGIITGLTLIFGTAFAIYRWFLKQRQQDLSIADLEEENEIICEGLSACLDGLIQLGANHNVPKIKEKLDEHLNKKAHQIDAVLGQ